MAQPSRGWGAAPIERHVARHAAPAIADAIVPVPHQRARTAQAAIPPRHERASSHPLCDGATRRPADERMAGPMRTAQTHDESETAARVRLRRPPQRPRACVRGAPGAVRVATAFARRDRAVTDRVGVPPGSPSTERAQAIPAQSSGAAPPRSGGVEGTAGANHPESSPGTWLHFRRPRAPDAARPGATM